MSNEITNEQLEAWAGLGPWRQEHMHTGGFDIFDPLDRDIVTIYGGGIGLDKIGPYAALIAAAPALAAALLAERKAREVEVAKLKTALIQIACEADEIYEASMSDGCDGPALLDFAKSAANIAHSALVDGAIRQALKGPTHD